MKDYMPLIVLAALLLLLTNKKQLPKDKITDEKAN